MQELNAQIMFQILNGAGNNRAVQFKHLRRADKAPLLYHIDINIHGFQHKFFATFLDVRLRVYKNKQARRYGYACAGHARRDAKIRADYV